jgi:UDP-GlcNAc:undecaprenyl-phosphate/decaprenyl-phosphate GlcNAc-1-phosphate transferase
VIPLQVSPSQPLPGDVASRIESLGREFEALGAQVKDLTDLAGTGPAAVESRLEIFHGYFPVFVVAFAVTLLATPLMRRLALAHGVIDRPDEARKLHRLPVAYLGGVAVFLGIVAGIIYSYAGVFTGQLMTLHPSESLGNIGPLTEHADPLNALVPFSVLLGLFIITFVGLVDDVAGVQPRLKIGGQLIAAAALAYENVGVRVANGLLGPLANALGFENGLRFDIPLPLEIPGIGASIPLDVVYWTGTAIIAVFVLGACNASNLIDGLDGLCTGVHAIAAAGLLVVALTLAMRDDGPRDAQRIILCLALLGACLGFLPHNFNPASIFLGDAGSMLLGYTTIVIVLTLGGEAGFTHMVLAGLVIYAIPIVDTLLAIVRRRLEGKSVSAADDQHLHHMLRRALGVKGAVFTLYGIGIACAATGVMMSLWRARVIYGVAIIGISFLVVTAIKAARRRAIEQEAAEGAARTRRFAPHAGTPPAMPRPTEPAAPVVADPTLARP